MLGNLDQPLTKEESYVQRRQLFKDIWETALNVDIKQDILKKPKVIKTLRMDEIDMCPVGKSKKQRIKNLRHVCKRILDFCDRQEANDQFYEQAVEMCTILGHNFALHQISKTAANMGGDETNKIEVKNKKPKANKPRMIRKHIKRKNTIKPVDITVATVVTKTTMPLSRDKKQDHGSSDSAPKFSKLKTLNSPLKKHSLKTKNEEITKSNVLPKSESAPKRKVVRKKQIGHGKKKPTAQGHALQIISV